MNKTFWTEKFRELTYQTAHWTAHDFIRELEDVVRDANADQELSNLIAEVVAVVCKDIVGFGSVSWADFLQIFPKHVLGDMCESQFDYMNWSPIGCSSSRIMLNSPREVVFLIIHHHAGMPGLV